MNEERDYALTLRLDGLGVRDISGPARLCLFSKRTT